MKNNNTILSNVTINLADNNKIYEFEPHTINIHDRYGSEEQYLQSIKKYETLLWNMGNRTDDGFADGTALEVSEQGFTLYVFDNGVVDVINSVGYIVCYDEFDYSPSSILSYMIEEAKKSLVLLMAPRVNLASLFIDADYIIDASYKFNFTPDILVNNIDVEDMIDELKYQLEKERA